MPGYYPIIYVRGYAFSRSEIDETSDDPTNGFNLGSTHARQGDHQRIRRFRFPGPFVRLMTEHLYTDSIAGETDSVELATYPVRTLWIYRYYEPYARTFTARPASGRPRIEQAAWNLKLFIDEVRQKAYPASTRDTDKKVILVAHSMGGLICRSMIAQVLKDDARQLIAKVVTYGTPHGGIEIDELAEFPERLTSMISFNGVNNFTPRRMFQFLNPTSVNRDGKTNRIPYNPSFDVRELQLFDPKNFLCIVGTNHEDYDAFFTLSRDFAGGPGSDGLVRIQNAWVNGAECTQIHRSHSGRYGMVNSNEGYQALERFLFGSLRAVVDLVSGPPGAPGGGGGGHPGGDQGPSGGGGGGHPGGAGDLHFLDVDCGIGPLDQVVNSRRAEHFNAIELTREMMSRAVRIHAFHLLARDLVETEGNEEEEVASGRLWSYRLKMSLRLRRDRYFGAQRQLMSSDSLMEQPVEVRIFPEEKGVGPETVVRYRWANIIGWKEATRENNAYVILIPLGLASELWGAQARLYLTLDNWNEDATDTDLMELYVKPGEKGREIRGSRRGRQKSEVYASDPVGVG